MVFFGRSESCCKRFVFLYRIIIFTRRTKTERGKGGRANRYTNSTMKNLFLFLILFVLTGGKNYTQAASSRDAIVYQEKDVRFTMLAEGVVRMEWSPSGQFVDAPSFVVVQRNLPVPEYKVRHKGEWVLIKRLKWR